MADTWLTIEQAAVALGMSVRTVNRHMTAGKLQSRLTEGRREVLISAPDAPAPAEEPAEASPTAETSSPIPPEPRPQQTVMEAAYREESYREDFYREDVRHSSGHVSREPTFDTETVLALADNAADKAELAVSAYQALARAADTQVRSVRRNALAAWAAVGIMTVGVIGAVAWTTHRITRVQVQTEELQKQFQTVSARADTVSAERDNLRGELASAREQTARAQGRLSALEQEQERLRTEQSEAQTEQPTPRPTLADRLTWLFD